MSPSPILALALLLAGTAPALAQGDAGPAPDLALDGAAAADDIVVTAPFGRESRDTTSPVTVIAAEELDRELRPQIGDVLARQAGVSTTSFGPNVSRPILRGLGGERVRVLTDGIGAFDVSNTSADHAVAIDPLLADSIEVLRGPASLRFGSSAIGGVVNLFDRRIPAERPEGAVAIHARGALGSAARERSLGARVTVPLSDQVLIGGGGSFSDTDDFRVGGLILSRRLRDEARASSDPEIRALAELAGRIPNSSSRTRNGHVGLAIVDGDSNLGAAVSRYESVYGLPIRFNLTPGVEQDAVSIDAHQTRADVRARLAMAAGLLDSFALRGGYADYAHVEREADGSAGTLFANKGYELRAELTTRQRGVWQGLAGAQTFFRDFLAVGEEAFVPPNETDQTGVFTVHQFSLGALRLEAGGRIERTAIRSDSVAFDRSFTANSLSLGALWTVASGWKIGVNLSSTARAPAAEELLANGPHVGTQTYEIGDPGFGIERARGVDLLLRADGPGWRFDASAYLTRFSGYIYEFETGEVREDLPVFQFAQGRARYRGLEVEGEATLVDRPGFRLSADATLDLVRATISGFGPAPRIPPLRVLGGIQLRSDSVGVRVEAEHAARQTRVTGFETGTPAFTLVNLSTDWTPFSDRDVRVTLSAANLLDVMARRHASFLKDYAPLGGRDIRLGLSARF